MWAIWNEGKDRGRFRKGQRLSMGQTGRKREKWADEEDGCGPKI